jgi:tetratricopeptide (TPR) repeat protein
VRPARPIHVNLLCALLWAACCLGTPCAHAAGGAALPDSLPVTGTADETVPYGVASNWLVGHQLLELGETGEALPYLHMAYRAEPDAQAVAMDFQAALAAEGYVRDALNVMDRLVGAHPDSSEYRLVRSSLLLEAGEPRKALDDLRHVREKGNPSARIVAAEAGILASQGDTDQALDVLRDGRERHPEFAVEFTLQMVDVMQRAGRYEAVAALLTAAVEEHPGRPSLWRALMYSQVILKKDADALATARRADALFAGRAEQDAPVLQDVLADEVPLDDPAPESFLVELADHYAQQRQISRAVDILTPLSASGELGLGPSLWLARLLLGTGRQEEGAALVADIVDRWPEAARGWFLRGKIAEGDGRWADAVPLYEKAVDLGPGDPEIRLAYVRALLVAWEGDLSARRPDAAQEEKRQLLRRQTITAMTLTDERDTEGQLILGYAFRTVGEHDKAERAFGAAAENPDLRLGALVQRSICLDDLGKEKRAQNVLEQAYRENPDNAEVANSLGYFLAEKGRDLERAEQLVRQALRAEPGNGAYLDSLGWIFYRRGELEQALDYLIQAVNVLPEDPVILEHLGLALKASGRPAEARDVLARALRMGGDPDRLQPVLDGLDGGTGRP